MERSRCRKTSQFSPSLTSAQQKHLDTVNSDGHGDGSSSWEVSLPFTHEDLHTLILAALASSVAGSLIERENWWSGAHLETRNRHTERVISKHQGVEPDSTLYHIEGNLTLRLYLNPWPRGRGVYPRPATCQDLRRISASQKKILKAVARQAIRE